MTDERDLVVLLNEDGTERSTAAKLAAHQPPGRLHLAFSVFLFDAEGRVLLQRRAEGKALFAGRWSNSCCSHPRPGEPVAAAAQRRVREELGLECVLVEVGRFDYHAHDPASGLDERERVHVLAGVSTAQPVPDPVEVAAVEFVAFAGLAEWVAREPARFSPWLAGAAREAEAWWARRFGPGNGRATRQSS